MEGLIFEKAYVQREICVSKSIGLAYCWKVFYCFYFGQIPSTSHPGGLYLVGQFNGGFFCVMSLGGLYLEGLNTWRGLLSEFYSMSSLARE